MLVVRRDVTIEWGDCDAAGIVFYPRYFAMFDAATHGLMARATGLSAAAMNALHGIVGIPMADTRVSFHIPSTYGDVVTIETQVERFGRSSFHVCHHLLKGTRLAAQCWEKRVWVAQHPDDPSRLHGVAVPPEIVAALSAG